MREFPSSYEILKVFEQQPAKAFRLRELVVELGLRSSQARELKCVLRELARHRKIVYLKKGHFALVSGDRHAVTEAHPPVPPAPEPAKASERRNLVSGRLIGHRDGYGFVVPDEPLGESGQDIFIPATGMSSAMHGDRVEVHVLRSKADGRLEGRIVQVRERAQKTVVGEFHCGPRFNYVLPFDHRLPFEIVIPRGQEWPAQGEPARHRQFGGESEGKRARYAAAGPERGARELENLIVDVEGMQRDILRLKTRLAHEHLRTEQVKRRLLEAQVETIEHADLTGTAIARIYEIYGLQPPREKPALPPADVTAVPAPLPSPPSQKSHADPSNPTDLSEIFL